MKKAFFLPAVFVVCFLRLHSQSTASNDMDHSSQKHVMVNAGDLQWMDAPPALPKGSRMALLSGDPSKAGPFAVRVMFPENYKVPAHWHPSYENVVVLEGTLYMGSGEKLDESKGMALNAGGYSAIPAKSPHYVFTKDKCVVQINSDGPFEMHYYNPADDPRTGK